MTRSPGARAVLLPLLALAVLCCASNSAIGPGPVVAVRMVPDSLALNPGQSFEVHAFPIDADTAFLANKVPTWATDDGGVAAVDDTGYVTAVGLGATDVTASVDGVVGRVHVTVSAPAITLESRTVTFTSARWSPRPAAGRRARVPPAYRRVSNQEGAGS